MTYICVSERIRTEGDKSVSYTHMSSQGPKQERLGLFPLSGQTCEDKGNAIKNVWEAMKSI